MWVLDLLSGNPVVKHKCDVTTVRRFIVLIARKRRFKAETSRIPKRDSENDPPVLYYEKVRFCKSMNDGQVENQPQECGPVRKAASLQLSAQSS